MSETVYERMKREQAETHLRVPVVITHVPGPKVLTVAVEIRPATWPPTKEETVDETDEQREAQKAARVQEALAMLGPKPKRARKPRQRITLGDEVVTRDEMQRRADALAQRLGMRPEGRRGDGEV